MALRLVNGVYKGGTKKDAAKLKAGGSSKLASSQSGVSNASSQYSALMKKYSKTLSPSSTEKKAQKSLDSLTTSYESGVAKTGQETMPMDLITGQKKGLLDQYGVQSAGYSRTIASEQAKRGAASDVLSAQSGLLEKQMASEQSANNSIAKSKTTGGKTSIGSILASDMDWETASQVAKANGIPTYTGSAFDLAANKKWGNKSKNWWE